MIVSASLLAYLEPFADDPGSTTSSAVELEVGDDGRLTGRPRRARTSGAREKAVRLRAWLGERPARELWAYGNSQRRPRAARHGRPTRLGGRAANADVPARRSNGSEAERAAMRRRLAPRCNVDPGHLGCMRMPPSMRIDSAFM